MNPLFRIDFSISDSLKIVRKSVLIYETIITYLHTQPLKVKPFINQWGVLRQKFIIKNMLKMNRMIVN